MTAALTGLPLLALLVATYIGVVLLLAAAVGRGARQPNEWVDLWTGDGPCDDPLCGVCRCPYPDAS